MTLRIAVTGWTGQVVCAMLERVPVGVEVIALRRPDLDLAVPKTVAPALRSARPDIIVNTAAYTAVDQAESEPELAMRVNGEAAGEAARAAATLGIPVIQLSTDYVFDGALARPYREDDQTGPISAYGASKLAGEQAVTAATDNHAILRTAWIYSPFGKNFVKTMLHLAETRDQIGVVADQAGCPTSALDIADAIFTVARNLTSQQDDARLRGVFHMSAAGEAVWADVAEAIFAERERQGGKPVWIKRIATADYPTPARRPANSRLDCSKLAQTHGVRLPDWQNSLGACIARLLKDQGKELQR
ncbi:dTDP-4-dehydrorhamnose reductase [Bosea sp. BE271]|uniref:dTDP-4-dehydrorhamnose reductase n=1 Tax=Bosea TaxID=85413 RepID=UPI00285E1BA4|nr:MULTISPECIES: dTDP-4-dehydrorhamnose reductase [Bosea]MDR6831213.1 dTDP-4-dehydrorhamnose reductase [Bosea robiniae]MDR6897977.1 dTDP-4-dehydrorhamnose reductase [Bosea sp. BE109]MDR7141350.1 dTDP-4-dehydrorhamnose reductase [Bosea sp. BE168]MDR7178012.1 dTDP-4-dehydrorhamnose reductase [Bosea sp. BE271]